jgi:O-antigen/teichoic acid export membrane protein
MSTSKRVLLNSGYLYAKMFITLFISLYTTRIILNVLGSSDFGLYNLVAGVVVMLAFINNTLTASSQRFMSHAQGQNKFDKQISIFNISLIIHIISGIIISVILIISGLFIFDGFLNIDSTKIYSAKVVFYNVIIITLINVVSVPFDAAINAHEDMLYFSILGFVETILKLIAALLLSVIVFDKLITYSIALLIIAVVLSVVKIFYVIKKYPESKIHPIKYFDNNIFKEMMSFSGWGFLTSTVSILTNYGQNIMINIFFGTKVNAAQGISGQAIGQVGAITNVMLKALNPVIFKSEGANNKDLFMQSIKSGSKLAFLSFSIIGIPVIFEMDFIFKLWLKEIPVYTIEFCTISMIGFILGQLTITVESAISATGKIKNFTIIKSITDVVPFLFTFLFFKLNYPPVTMYIVSLIFEIVRQSIVLYFGNKLCNIDIKEYMLDNILKPIVLSLMAILSIVLIQSLFSPSIFRVLLSSGISALLTLLLYYFIGFTNRERIIIDSLLLMIKNKASLSINKIK